jgi:hypothetical protein
LSSAAVTVAERSRRRLFSEIPVATVRAARERWLRQWRPTTRPLIERTEATCVGVASGWEATGEEKP